MVYTHHPVSTINSTFTIRWDLRTLEKLNLHPMMYPWRYPNSPLLSLDITIGIPRVNTGSKDLELHLSLALSDGSERAKGNLEAISSIPATGICYLLRVPLFAHQIDLNCFPRLIDPSAVDACSRASSGHAGFQLATCRYPWFFRFASYEVLERNACGESRSCRVSGESRILMSILVFVCFGWKGTD